MPTLAETVNEFFESEGWALSELEAGELYTAGFEGENGQWSCYAQVREALDQFVFYSVCPAKAPADRRADIAEFVCRANYGLAIGNFEIDFDDGEIRFKTGIDVEGDRLSVALVRSLVYANVLTTDRYLPGIMQVVYGNVSPVDAITAIEST